MPSPRPIPALLLALLTSCHPGPGRPAPAAYGLEPVDYPPGCVARALAAAAEPALPAVRDTVFRIVRADPWCLHPWILRIQLADGHPVATLVEGNGKRTTRRLARADWERWLELRAHYRLFTTEDLQGEPMGELWGSPSGEDDRGARMFEWTDAHGHYAVLSRRHTPGELAAVGMLEHLVTQRDAQLP